MAAIEEKREKSKREQAVERLSSRYPDKDFSDDEALFGQVNDDYDDYDSQLNGYKEREQKLSDLFTSDPRSAHFVNNWMDGGDPAVELVRLFGETDLRAALDDPSRLDALSEANKEYVERVSKSKELEEQYGENLKSSLEDLEAMKQERGMSDEELDEAMTFLVGLASDAILGKFSRESVDMALKAINHDEDVAVAGQEAEVRGRNAKIGEQLRQRSGGDGVTALGGGNTPAKPQRGSSIFDVAAGAK